jgi:hypothetical protein
MYPQTFSYPQFFNNMLVGGYANAGNQMQNAMQQIGQVNKNNQIASTMNRANYDAPVDVARINADAQTEIANSRTNALSPLLQALVGGLGGFSTAFGNPSGGFNAVGADGKQFASATQGGSAAQPTQTSQYKPPTRFPRAGQTRLA